MDWTPQELLMEEGFIIAHCEDGIAGVFDVPTGPEWEPAKCKRCGKTVPEHD